MTKYLLIGPHPDDVELGCVASILQMTSFRDAIRYVVLSKCLDIPRNEQIEEEFDLACNRIKQYLKKRDYSAYIHDFKNRRLHSQAMEIRKQLEVHRDEFNPDVVFVTHYNDYHQDHSYLAEESFRVFRSCSIACYEIPRHIRRFLPNMYVRLEDISVNMSIDVLASYKSQETRFYMAHDLIKSTYRHRGGEVGTKYAQAFEIVRWVV